MVKILNAMQLKSGAKADNTKSYTLIQPVQFLRREQKDEAWGAWNMDWYEMQGINQLRRNARRMMKNYKLVNGIIDKSDYIVEEDNEAAEMIDILTKSDESAFELKFYPIIPNVANVLTGEFIKRNDKIIYKAVDKDSYNEMVQAKGEMIGQVLMQYGEQKMIETIQSLNVDMESEEGQQYVQEMMSPENIKSLPEIEEYFRKDYRSLIEEWATHQHAIDQERFRMPELEKTAFIDMIAVDREFWHFKMLEDDYEIELWNPALTFCFKSPETRYVSNASCVGRVELMTLSDVLDKYGYLMSDKEIESLQQIYPVKGANYIMPGIQNDGSFYDATKSHQWNTEGPSLGLRQFMTARELTTETSDDILEAILNDTSPSPDLHSESLLRVTPIYWMSQRLLYNLTRITDEGEVIELIVDESYKITEPAVYNTKIKNKRDRETLVYGEHLEPIWINEAWGGTKIGPNRPSYYGQTGIDPIYLDVKPCKFQFKGDYSLYGCKLPVEGTIYTDRNVKSMSLVDKMKPYQIGFNLVNNQISDILIDELGTIILFDQNALPRHSMGEDWGNNYQKAFTVMKNFQMMPLDTSITNTGNALNFQHYQVLNLEQTQRLLSRIQLANYFKQQAFEAIGITPQRMGNINSQETATGIEQSINMSYSQTDILFTQHCEYLMPRVHEMRTNLAQYYHSTNPSLRLQYMTTLDEQVNFQINGTELLGRELNVYLTTSIKQRQLMEQIRGLAKNNNTTGATIYDLGTLMASESFAEINSALKLIDKKAEKNQQAEREHRERLIQIEEDEANKRLEAELRFKSEENEADRERDIRVAEIRSAAYTAMMDRNENNRSDYIDTIEYLDKKHQNDEKIAISKESNAIKLATEQQKLGVKREELQARKEIANKQLQVAQTNKNQYDFKKDKKKDKK